jgi:hypothetical protein
MVAAGQNDGKVRLWSAITGRNEGLIECHDYKSIMAVHFDAAGENLLVAGDTGLQVWDLANRKKLKEWHWPDKSVTAAAFGSAGEKIALITKKGAIEIWSTSAGKKISGLQFPENISWHILAFSADGTHLAAGSVDGAIVLSGTGDKPFNAVLQNSGGTAIRSMAFSPGGARLASVRGREGVAVWDVATKKQHKKLPTGSAPYHTLTFSPKNDSVDGVILAAGCGNGAVQLWDANSGEDIVMLRGHAGLILALAFASDGMTLASASSDALVRVWDCHRIVKMPEIKLEPIELENLIKELGSDDDIKVSRATLTLSAAVPQTLAAFKKTLRQGVPPDVKQIRALIDDLQSEQFAVRNKATQKLAALGEAARPELRYALTKQIDLETKRRIESLLDRLVDSFGVEDQRLTRRAIAILERIGDDKAKQILRGVLYGVPDDAIISEARAVLERLDSPKK